MDGVEHAASRFAFAVHRRIPIVIALAVLSGTAAITSAGTVAVFVTGYPQSVSSHVGLIALFAAMTIVSFGVYFASPFVTFSALKRSTPVEWFVAWRLEGVVAVVTRCMNGDTEHLWGSEAAEALRPLLFLGTAYRGRFFGRHWGSSASRVIESRVSRIREAVVSIAVAGVVNDARVRQTIREVTVAAVGSDVLASTAGSDEKAK